MHNKQQLLKILICSLCFIIFYYVKIIRNSNIQYLSFNKKNTEQNLKCIFNNS